MTCTGKFDWPIAVDAPGLVVEPGEKSGQLQITIPPDLAADRVWLRLHNAEGASAAVPFLIGNLPEVNETEPNDAPRQSQEFERAHLVVNGVLKGADCDSFSVPLEAGQTLVAAVEADFRLGSPIDTVVQIALPSGMVVADNHDDVGLDPRVAYTAKTAGRYLVRVFGFSSTPNTSIALQGGDNCIYRLTITTGPFVTHAVPLSVSSDEPGAVVLHGWNIPENATAAVVPFGEPAATTLFEMEPRGLTRISPESRLGIANLAESGGSARVRLVPFITSAAIQRPLDDAPLPLPVPHAVTGCLRVKGQADAYRVTLQKGNPLLVTAESRSLGLQPDPLIQLLDPDGKKVAEVDDVTGTRDAVLTHNAAKDGDYTIIVTDRHRAGSDRGFYQMTVRLDEPDFELTTAEDAFVLPVDKPVELVVNVTRRGAAGEISINAVDLPEGITSEPVVSETKGDSAKKVTLKLSGNGTAYSGRIRIVGTMSAPRMLERTAETPARQGGAFPSLWLTAIGKPDAQPVPDAEKAADKPAETKTP